MDIQFAQFKEQVIAFSTSGKGTPVIFLHGFCEDARMWSDFLPAFQKRLLIQVDLPGFGSSPLSGPQSVEDMAEGLKAVVDQLAIDRFILVAHSMGGYVALAFAEKYASQLMGLCLFHSHPFADTDEKKASRNKSIDFVRRNGAIHYVKQVVPSLFAPSFSNRHLVDKLVFHASQTSDAGIINGLEAMRDRPDRSAVLASLSCPVQFIIGLKDGVFSERDSLEQTHLPSIADIKILPNTGHMGMHSAADKTSTYIRKFIDYCLSVQAPISVP